MTRDEVVSLVERWFTAALPYDFEEVRGMWDALSDSFNPLDGGSGLAWLEVLNDAALGKAMRKLFAEYNAVNPYASGECELNELSHKQGMKVGNLLRGIVNAMEGVNKGERSHSRPPNRRIDECR